MGEVADDVRLGSVDAGFIWSFMVRPDSPLKVVAVPELARADALVSVCILKSTQKPEAADAFTSFIASENGVKILNKNGFEPVDKSRR